MAKDQGVNMPTARANRGAPRPPASTKGQGAVAAPAAPPKKRTTPAQFAKEVRAEARKITWTSWKETWITSVMVLIMVVVTSVFFLLVDGSLSFLMQQLLKLAG